VMQLRRERGGGVKSSSDSLTKLPLLSPATQWTVILASGPPRFLDTIP
jgi:hypothetical protein